MRSNDARQALLALVLLSLSLYHPVAADTIVGGMIITDTAWTALGNPYVVTESILVMNGAKLTIRSGTVVRFQPGKALVVNNGYLVARGTVESNILFTADAASPGLQSNRWGYVGFGPSAADASFDQKGNWTNGCTLEYVCVEYAGQSAFAGAIYCDHSTPFLHGCRIKSNSRGGVFANYGTGLRATDNVVSNNQTAAHGGGFYLLYCDGAIVDGNTFAANTADEGGALYLEWCAGVRLNANICERNTARSGGAVMVESSDNTLMSGNTFTGNSAVQGGGLYGVRINGLGLTGETFATNGVGQGAAIYFASGWAHSRVKLSADSARPSIIIGTGSVIQVYNAGQFTFSSEPEASGNIDARNVWWGTTDPAQIQGMIFDFFDDASKGIVFYSPFAAPNTNQPPEFTAASMSNGSLKLAFTNTFQGGQFAVEKCHDLASNDWQAVTSLTVGASSSGVSLDCPDTGPCTSAFYRVRGSEWMLKWE
jgi:hypothetical protein